MTLTYVLMQNLRRSPLRTTLTATVFALTMAVFVLAISFVVFMIQLGKANERELRLVVHHKTTITNPLPVAVRKKIEALDPNHEKLTAVCGMRWYGGRVPGTQNTITSLGTDVDTLPIVYPDLGMTNDSIAAWERDRRAAVVGIAAAKQHNWKVGDRVVLESTIPPYLQLEFNIVYIIQNPARSSYFFLRRDYVDEALKTAGIDDSRCNTFWVKCKSANALHEMQRDIDALFANSPDETKSEDENAFGASFIQAAGNIPGLMQSMAIVVVVIISLVAGNTMMMSFRERIRELAVFKAIGFHAGSVFRIVLAESIILAIVGALIGVVPLAYLLAWALPHIFKIFSVPLPPMITFRVSWPGQLASLIIAFIVGLAAGILPAWQAMRLKSVDALRRA